jgi:membrane-bound lytic murein transglycosylase B
MTGRAALAAAVAAALWGSAAGAQGCGDGPGGFEAWKQAFAPLAQAEGVGRRGLEALAQARYSTETIRADRGQRSFRYSLDEFLRVRGADAIIAQGRRMKARSAEFYASLERGFGVPAGVLIAIHGMETGFGNFMGDTNLVSASATLAYDCRRPQFFTPHLIAALKLVDQGAISAATVGAKHGELGHTQFLPGNVLAYGRDGNGDGRVDLTNLSDAMVSTANYLAGKGWRAGAGYQPGEPNFAVIAEWNAASVYQQAIALMAARIDG